MPQTFYCPFYAYQEILNLTSNIYGPYVRAALRSFTLTAVGRVLFYSPIYFFVNKKRRRVKLDVDVQFSSFPFTGAFGKCFHPTRKLLKVIAVFETVNRVTRLDFIVGYGIVET